VAELSRREWIIRGLIKGAGRVVLGWALMVILFGGPLPRWLVRWIDEVDPRG
jgi:hypothetical protein